MVTVGLECFGISSSAVLWADVLNVLCAWGFDIQVCGLACCDVTLQVVASPVLWPGALWVWSAVLHHRFCGMVYCEFGGVWHYHHSLPITGSVAWCDVTV